MKPILCDAFGERRTEPHRLSLEPVSHTKAVPGGSLFQSPE